MHNRDKDAYLHPFRPQARYEPLHKTNNMITASEHWSGFTFVFSNGWSISIQQSENHYCKVGETVEVAIFDPADSWYGYDEEKCEIFVPSENTHVVGHCSADNVGKIISIISQEKVDIRTSK